ncbi:MAG TPA: hypothetical protein VGT40_14720 [Methylomirabilota bacterium]|nr:hypothetical protein [Methylomirabilota bacterium]
MDEFRPLVVVMAGAGAVIAAAAALGKLSGRLGDRVVDRLYYLSYGCTALSILLFIMRGLFAERP